MDIQEIRNTVGSDDYKFLKKDPHLGDNIILLAVSGSHSYGTNVDGSDLDIRGCALNSRKEILTGIGFEQIQDHETDSTIYSFNKLVSLLSNSNPNTLELLGCKPEHYLYCSDIGAQLLSKADLFLSQEVARTFGGYANAQLKRIENELASKTDGGSDAIVENMIAQIRETVGNVKAKYTDAQSSPLIDVNISKDTDSGEILISSEIRDVQFSDYAQISNEITQCIRNAGNIGRRSKYAIEHGRIQKHMMHLVRLYVTCIDILRTGKIRTYREKEREFLLDVRNEKYVDDSGAPSPEFFKIVDKLEEETRNALAHTDLPKTPNYKKIEEFTMEVNSRIVEGSYN